MNVLGLDCATSACSVAWWCDGRILSRRLVGMARGHAEALLPMAIAVATEARAEARSSPTAADRRAAGPFAGLDLIAVTIGPGAFTGLRIGLAAARGLAIATGVPIAGVTTLEVVAAGVPVAERGACLIVALETKRADVYWQVFDAGLSPLTEPAAGMPESLAAELARRGAAVLVGDAAPRVLAAAAPTAMLSLGPGSGVPDAAHVAAVAAARWQSGGVTPPAVPLYLRSPDVTLASAKGAG